MNHLFLGTGDFTPLLLEKARPPFLYIADDVTAFARAFPTAAQFDLATHHFNPLKGMDDAAAQEFVAALYSYSPEGETTLTVRNGKRALRRMLPTSPRLDDLKPTHHPGDEEAVATVSDILLSPVLKRVLCRRANFSFRGRRGEQYRSVLVQLDRTVITEFDAFLLATLFVQQHRGQIIIEDFGFYGRTLHTSLIRQNRLIAGVTRLADLPDKIGVNRFHTKTPLQALPEDARVLAEYAGLIPDPTRADNDYTRFIRKATSATVP